MSHSAGTGITCIVGPNGCGKSNIVDAISWVLGEQSHKILRAERMSDCIFNGTVKRPPDGHLGSQLTLVNPELAEAAAKVLRGRRRARPSPPSIPKTRPRPCPPKAPPTPSWSPRRRRVKATHATDEQ